MRAFNGVLRLFLLIALCFAFPVGISYAATKENQLKTCEAVLANFPEAKQCKGIFPEKGDCCSQYDAKKLAVLCAKMSSIQSALVCFSEIHEVGFWKTDLLPEHRPGLGIEWAGQWKKNVMRVCASEPDKKAAINCAILQKSGVAFAFRQADEEVVRQAEEAQGQAMQADPVFQFCRKAFGEYWEGVEKCVQDQRAAKKRMGQ